MIDVRSAFFLDDVGEEGLTRAAELAHIAVAQAPELAESHLALGHVELHSGNPIAAAGHYRTAIARAPYSSEAHEYLGRMLLEAGYVDRAIPRLEEAMAIAPSRRSIAWELARAYALDGNFDEHDRIVGELNAAGSHRVFARARIASWRRDPELMKEFLDDVKRADRLFVKGLMSAMFAVYTNEPWPPQRDKLFALVTETPPNRRRRTFVAQLAAEAAGWAGDVETAAAIVAHATADGLFDLHWLERCALLEDLRASPQYARVRAPIKRRAEAILDALYGDQDLGTSDTAYATT